LAFIYRYDRENKIFLGSDNLKKISAPLICEIDYEKEAILNLEKLVGKGDHAKYLLRFPTVYIVNNQEHNNKYAVYVGETTDIKRRSLEHLQIDPEHREDWQRLVASKTTKMFLIGHDHFNKSLALDIENKLMHYLSSVDAISFVYNRRTNQQNEYYTSDEMDTIFSKIWRNLHMRNKELFPLEQVIRDSALFKASPFHKLTREQFDAQDMIIMKIEEALNREKEGQLILVSGEAGSGKTVLMSSLFYELFQLSAKTSDNPILRNSSQCLLVNHDQQLTVYQQIAKKLGILSKRNPKVVDKPTPFITRHTTDEKTDVIIVDEAHLLWTQGKQAYQGQNQLKDLLNRAKVVVAIFDQNQILSREQYWENDELLEVIHQANLAGNYIKLHDQLRINGNAETVNWIRDVVDKQRIMNIPKDEKYDLQVFRSPEQMYEAIKKKAKNEKSGISRILATFDWPYVDKGRPENHNNWNVTVGDFQLPWNLQLPVSKELKFKNRTLAWAEQPQTIGEVGSTFTIQGFDLNYAGVIIGPSVKYRRGKIIFDANESKNKKATQRRTLKSGEKTYVYDQLLKNELNVLLTRGVNGLYLYAVDDALQEKLLAAQRGDL
jgi:DUF2075 family protein/archaellum biogenesis ATPase FlaH/predicted GIY-YIG superfamily endonuclease